MSIDDRNRIAELEGRLALAHADPSARGESRRPPSPSSSCWPTCTCRRTATCRRWRRSSACWRCPPPGRSRPTAGSRSRAGRWRAGSRRVTRSGRWRTAASCWRPRRASARPRCARGSTCSAPRRSSAWAVSTTPSRTPPRRSRWRTTPATTGWRRARCTTSGASAYRNGDLAGARDHYEQALGLYRRLRDDWRAAMARSDLGLILKNQCEWDAAAASLQRRARDVPAPGPVPLDRRRAAEPGHRLPEERRVGAGRGVLRPGRAGLPAARQPVAAGGGAHRARQRRAAAAPLRGRRGAVRRRAAPGARAGGRPRGGPGDRVPGRAGRGPRPARRGAGPLRPGAHAGGRDRRPRATWWSSWSGAAPTPWSGSGGSTRRERACERAAGVAGAHRRPARAGAGAPGGRGRRLGARAARGGACAGWADVVRRLTTVRERYELARTLFDLGRAEDDPRDGRRHLYRASALFAELAAHDWLERTDRRAAAAAGRRGRGAGAPGAGPPAPRAAARRLLARDAAGRRAGAPRRGHRPVGADHRRDRDRQGDRRAHHPRAVVARRPAVPGGQLRRAARRAGAVAALRPPQGGLHRARTPTRPAWSRRPTAGRCAWTRSASCRTTCR